LTPLRLGEAREDWVGVGLQEFSQSEEALETRLSAAARRLAEQFEGIHDEATCRRVVDESAAELSDSAVTPFIHILAERFAADRLRVQAQSEGRLAKTVPEVLFVSLTGGGRAEIGAALLARELGEKVAVHSAGSRAVREIDANVRTAMEEVGIDLSESFTKPLSNEILRGADVIVTMGRSVGPVEIPEHVTHVDWRVGDPAGAPLSEVRRVREDIERRIAALADDLVPEH
jgi:arsenate reductase (thioredoxin)